MRVADRGCVRCSCELSQYRHRRCFRLVISNKLSGCGVVSVVTTVKVPIIPSVLITFYFFSFLSIYYFTKKKKMKRKERTGPIDTFIKKKN